MAFGEMTPVTISEVFLVADGNKRIMVLTLNLAPSDTSDVVGPTLWCASDEVFDCNHVVKVKEEKEEKVKSQ